MGNLMKNSLMTSAAAAVLGLAIAAGGYSAPEAQAADFAPYAPPPAPMFSWTGFYVGGTVGGGLMESEFTDDLEYQAYGHMGLSDWGVALGATAGYNYQFGAGVLGVEADWSWTNFKNDKDTDFNPTRHKHEWNWFATFRARAGLAVDRALIYATGGLALVDVEYEAFEFDDYDSCGDDPYGACVDKTQLGFTVGAGAEYAVSHNVSAKLEYLYIGLPSKNTTADADDDVTFSYKSNAHIVRVGVNWLF